MLKPKIYPFLTKNTFFIPKKHFSTKSIIFLTKILNFLTRNLTIKRFSDDENQLSLMRKWDSSEIYQIKNIKCSINKQKMF